MAAELLILKGYQEKAIQRATDDPFHALFLDMGLGKTVIVLTVIKDLLDLCEIRGALVVAPMRVVYTTWQNEVKRWAQFNGLRVVNLHATQAQDPTGMSIVDVRRPADIYTINPESLGRLFGKRVVVNEKPVWANGPWKIWRDRPDMLVVDESSMFKNPSSVRSQTIRRFLPDFRRRIIMTGTPAPNGVQDLYAQFLLIDQGEALGKGVTKFRERFMHAIEQSAGGRRFYRYLPRAGAMEEIQELIKPHCTVMEAADWLKLPDRQTVEIPIVLPPSALELYRRAKEEAYAQLQTGEEIFARGGAAVKLKQICNGQVYVGASPTTEAERTSRKVSEIHKEKLKALVELLEERQGAPTLVAYEFQCDGGLLSKELGAPMICGGMTGAESSELIDQWNAGKLPVLLVQPQSASHGLNMQFGGNALVWYTPPWNLEVYQQMNARLHRQGQSAPCVFIYHLVAQDAVDQRIMQVLDAKGATQAELIEALKEEIAS